MLVHLRIKNLAVIEDASIPFGEGLNIVTGETGAGKSIVAQALQIVLGERAKSDWIRRGAKSAEVEALFRFSTSFPLVPKLQELEWLSDDDSDEYAEVLIRRVLSGSGRSRVFVNGHLTTVALDGQSPWNRSTGQVKAIIILRDPVDRMRSEYFHTFRDKLEPLGFRAEAHRWGEW